MARTAEVTRSIASILRGSPRRQQRAEPNPREIGAKIGYLKENDVFSSLPRDEHVWLAESTTMFTCDPGRVFYAPDEQGEAIFILKRGKVNLYRIAPDGRKLVVGSLGKGSIFGEMAMIGQGMYGCFAEASAESLLCVLSRSDLQSLITRNPEVGLKLLSQLGERLQEREEELESLAFRAIPNRLAAFLLREADGQHLVAGFSHQDIAERLGTYRETVSLTLGKFKTEGLVAVEPKRIQLLDIDRLEDIADS